jgi:hypothetical protein
MLLGLKPGHACGVISVVAEFVVMLLGLKPGHACDVISVAEEFMVDDGGVEARPRVCLNSIPLGLSTLLLLPS